MSNLPDPRESIVVSHRPWGHFERFTSNEVTTVKVVTVEPGHRLSLQTHEHRGEFWQVLDGPLDVTVDGESWVARAGDKVWVPPGAVHRMGNSSGTTARVLEIGYGDFDEADIVRLEDDYRR